MEPLIRSYGGTIEDVSMANRTVVATVNTGDLDRYATVIDPSGIDLKQYRYNPVVLWEHGKDPNRGTLPIGRNVWIKAVKSGHGVLRAATKFAKDDYSQALLEMYRDETLRGWSINVLPNEDQSSPPTKDELRARPELSRCKMVYRGGELAEYSGVSVPGNANCLTLLERRGIWFPAEARASTPGATPIGTDRDEPDADDEGGPSDDDADDIDRYITHEGGEYVVHAEDGKVLGKHKDKGSAVAQLQAIEAHKHGERHLPPIQGMRFEDIHRTLRAEIDRHYARQMELVREWGELMRGRV